MIDLILSHAVVATRGEVSSPIILPVTRGAKLLQFCYRAKEPDGGWRVRTTAEALLVPTAGCGLLQRSERIMYDKLEL